MPDTDSLETNQFGSNATAFDPFGLLTEDERAHLDRIVAADPQLPLPGTVLPLTWNPTPPEPRVPRERARTVTEHTTRYNNNNNDTTPRCGGCGSRSLQYVVVANNNYIWDHVGLRPGTRVCGTCYRRRVRFDRYQWTQYRRSCQGQSRNGDNSIAPVSVVAYIPPTATRRDLASDLQVGAHLCGTCDGVARNATIRTVRIL